MKWWFQIPLWARVMGALVLGVAVGEGLKHGLVALAPMMGADPAFADETARGWIKAYLGPVGDVFVRLLRMLVVPLVLTTLVAGIVALGDPRKLGSIGVKTMALFLITTFFANLIGIGFGLLFQPGVGANLGASVSATAPTIATADSALKEILLSIVPSNPVAALAEGHVLSIIFFATLLGIGILMAGDAGKPLGDVFTSASEAVLKVTQIVMEFAPLGVFALVSFTVATQGLESLKSIAVLVACVYAGLLTHMLLVYGGLVRIFANLPVLRFFRGIVDAQAVAFSTASSSATLPVTLSRVSDKLGVNRSVAGSVLPLGATVNMDGTALYLGILAMFTAQAFGYTLGWENYLIIALTAAVVSIGAAGIPSSSLFLLAIVLQTFGVTPEQIALIVGFILPVDRVMDMARTTANITGDAAVAVTVARWEKEIDLDVYKGTAKVEDPEAA